MTNVLDLPADLPVPDDDGAAQHLPGLALPPFTFPGTDGSTVALNQPGRSVVYLYPRTGRPGVDLPTGWDSIPGARGCTPESCGFRDYHADLLAAGVNRVFGLSSQDTEYQAEAAERLNLPFPLLSDPTHALGVALRLPTFTVDGMTLYKRLTLIVQDGVIEHVFYPVFPPDTHAERVLTWLRANSQ